MSGVRQSSERNGGWQERGTIESMVVGVHKADQEVELGWFPPLPVDQLPSEFMRIVRMRSFLAEDDQFCYGMQCPEADFPDLLHYLGLDPDTHSDVLTVVDQLWYEPESRLVTWGDMFQQIAEEAGCKQVEIGGWIPSC